MRHRCGILDGFHDNHASRPYDGDHQPAPAVFLSTKQKYKQMYNKKKKSKTKWIPQKAERVEELFPGQRAHRKSQIQSQSRPERGARHQIQSQSRPEVGAPAQEPWTIGGKEN